MAHHPDTINGLACINQKRVKPCIPVQDVYRIDRAIIYNFFCVCSFKTSRHHISRSSMAGFILLKHEGSPPLENFYSPRDHISNNIKHNNTQPLTNT